MGRSTQQFLLESIICVYINWLHISTPKGHHRARRCKRFEDLKFTFFRKQCSSSQIIIFITICYFIKTPQVYAFAKHSGVSSMKISPLRERILQPEEVTTTSVVCRTRERVSPGTSNCAIILPNPSVVLAKCASHVRGAEADLQVSAKVT